MKVQEDGGRQRSAKKAHRRGHNRIRGALASHRLNQTLCMPSRLAWVREFARIFQRRHNYKSRAAAARHTTTFAMTDTATEESTMSTAAHHGQSSHDTTVEVVLSRPSYRLGGSVVGTIRLTAKQDVDPRAWFQSARVYVAGRCRVDGRWHNPIIYERIYGQHPHLRDHVDLESSSETVCFWATNVVNLLELEERTVGQWKDVNPKAMVRKSDLLGECEAAAYEDHWPEESTGAPLESQHLAFTFRVDLPLDIPHSAVAACVRYSYSAVVSATTVSNEVRRILHEPPYGCFQTTYIFLRCCDYSFSS
jgi:hypothetical protein